MLEILTNASLAIAPADCEKDMGICPRARPAGPQRQTYDPL